MIEESEYMSDLLVIHIFHGRDQNNKLRNIVKKKKRVTMNMSEYICM